MLHFCRSLPGERCCSVDLPLSLRLFGLQDRTIQYPEDAPVQGSPTGAIIEILGSTPPHKWSDKQIEELKSLRHKLEKVRQREDRELIGKEQLDFVEKESGSDQTWTVVAQTTNVADIGTDYEKAVRLAMYALASPARRELCRRWRWLAVVRHSSCSVMARCLCVGKVCSARGDRALRQHQRLQSTE